MLDFNSDKIDFDSTGNPLYAWDRIYKAWRDGAPLPEWVIEYLGKSAEKILSMKPKTGQHATQIKNALGLNGRHFSAFHKQPFDSVGKDIDLKRAIYDRVEEERQNRPWGGKGERIFEDIAIEFFDDSARFSTVRAYYYEWADMLEEEKNS